MSKVCRFVVGLMMIIVLMVVLASTISIRNSNREARFFAQQGNVATYTPTQFDNVYITVAP